MNFRMARIIRAKYLLLAGIPLMLSACATTSAPHLSSINPASPEAKQASGTIRPRMLGADDATTKSNDLITAFEKGTLKPVPAKPSDMSSMPGMKM